MVLRTISINWVLSASILIGYQNLIVDLIRPFEGSA